MVLSQCKITSAYQEPRRLPLFTTPIVNQYSLNKPEQFKYSDARTDFLSIIQVMAWVQLSDT